MKTLTVPEQADQKQTEEALQAAMQGLALDRRRPVALEIAGNGATGSKQFVLRAADASAGRHASAQLQGSAPQLGLRALGHDDPLLLRPGESVSVLELRPGAAAYQPMRDMEKTDPIRGILAALTLPADLRAVAQIGLLPAPPSWSKGQQRKGLEHVLEPERQRHRDALLLAKAGVPRVLGLVVLALVLVAVVLFTRFEHTLPAWYVRGWSALVLHGHPPPLSWVMAVSLRSCLRLCCSHCLLIC